jgi:hypothetical protein
MFIQLEREKRVRISAKDADVRHESQKHRKINAWRTHHGVCFARSFRELPTATVIDP